MKITDRLENRNNRPPRLGGNPGGAAVSALAITGSIFLLLPISQYFSWEKDPVIHDVDIVVLPAPEAPPEEIPPPPEDDPKPDDPELDVERQLPTIEQMELSFQPAAPGVGGDFGPPRFQVTSESLDTTIFSPDQLDDAPQAIRRIAPRYPEHLRRTGVAGRAVVQFLVDERGSVREARIESATHVDFGPAALDAIEGWKFKPGLKDGRKVRFRMRVPFAFNLD